MALGRPLPDMAQQFNSQYNIQLDVSGYDKVGIQIVAPTSGTINFAVTNDSGAVLGVTQGNAKLAINWDAAQVLNLATGASATTMVGAGNYSYDVRAQFIQLSGTPGAVNVYKLLLFNSKID